MNLKFREVQLNEIKNIKVLRVTPLFIIFQGKLYDQDIIMYKIRCLPDGMVIFENLLLSNNKILNFQSSKFCQRIGYINNSQDKSLILLYSLPSNGFLLNSNIFFTDETDLRRKFKLLDNMFHLIYLLKKTARSLDIGCISPNLFIAFYDTEKDLFLVDYIFAFLFQNTSNTMIRMLCGFFGSNYSDEIAMSCLLILYAFMNNYKCSLSFIQIVYYYNELTEQEEPQKIVDLKDKQGNLVIEDECIRDFLLSIFEKKKNRTYIYDNFYLDFKEFATSLMEKKGINKKQMMTQTEKFYFLMSEKNVKMSKLKKLKDDEEFFFNTFFVKSDNIFLTLHDDISNKVDSINEERNNYKSSTNQYNQKFLQNIETFNKKIKTYLKKKIDSLKKKKNLSLKEVKQLGEEIEKTKAKLKILSQNKINDALAQFTNDGDVFLNNFDLYLKDLLPEMFESFTTKINLISKASVIQDEPSGKISGKGNLSSLHVEPVKYKNIKGNFYPFINENKDTITIIKNDSTSIEAKCKFSEDLLGSSIKSFFPFSQWVTFHSFIIVTGGDGLDNNPSTLTLLIDLTKEKEVIVHKLDNMKQSRKYHSMCKINDYSVIVCGGSEKMVESYSLISNKWTTMPSLLYRKRNGILLLLNETKLYYFGGNQKTKLVQTLDLLKTLTIGWKPLLLNLEVSLTKCGIIPVNRATFIAFGGYEGQENSKYYNNKFYKFDLKENKVEEFENHSITFNLSYKFEECEFIHVDQTFNQVGMNVEGKVNLVSLNKKLFSI